MSIVSCTVVMTDSFLLDEVGIRRTDVVNWYLKERESEIDSQAELEDQTFLINRILDRLIHSVCFLLFTILLRIYSSLIVSKMNKV